MAVFMGQGGCAKTGIFIMKKLTEIKTFATGYILSFAIILMSLNVILNEKKLFSMNFTYGTMLVGATPLLLCLSSAIFRKKVVSNSRKFLELLPLAYNLIKKMPVLLLILSSIFAVVVTPNIIGCNAFSTSAMPNKILASVVIAGNFLLFLKNSKTIFNH